MGEPEREYGKCVMDATCNPIEATAYGAVGLLLFGSFSLPPPPHISILDARTIYMGHTSGIYLTQAVLQRAWRLWILSKPNQATIKLLGICGLIGVSTLIDHWTYSNTGNMMATLMSAGAGAVPATVKRQFNIQIVVSLACALSQGVIKETMLLIQREMGIAMGMKVERNLCKRLEHCTAAARRRSTTIASASAEAQRWPPCRE